MPETQILLFLQKIPLKKKSFFSTYLTSKHIVETCADFGVLSKNFQNNVRTVWMDWILYRDFNSVAENSWDAFLDQQRQSNALKKISPLAKEPTLLYSLFASLKEYICLHKVSSGFLCVREREEAQKLQNFLSETILAAGEEMVLGFIEGMEFASLSIHRD